MKTFFTKLLPVGLCVTVLTCMLSGKAVAFDEEGLFFQEIPTVYSALKIEQPITEVPAAITVITAEEIANMGTLEYVDIFRKVSGLDMFVKTYSDQDLSIRGFGYLLPGHPHLIKVWSACWATKPNQVI